jgi:hypothetical protein
MWYNKFLLITINDIQFRHLIYNDKPTTLHVQYSTVKLTGIHWLPDKIIRIQCIAWKKSTVINYSIRGFLDFQTLDKILITVQHIKMWFPFSIFFKWFVRREVFYWPNDTWASL